MRTKLEHQRIVNMDLLNQLKFITAERDRYKVALKKIANFKDWSIDKSILLLKVEETVKLAKQALEGK